MMSAMRRTSLLLLGCWNAACGGASTLPIELEVKDGAGVPGGKWDEIQLIVRSLPGAELEFNGQTKSMDATRTTEQFSVPKSTLKLGKNSFVVRAKTGALFSKREGEKTIAWDAQPKALLRFHGSSKGDSEALTCSGALCGEPSLKVTKAGHLPLEIESAIAGTVTMGGAKADVAGGQKAATGVDLLALVAARSVGELTQVGIPFTFEANGAKGDDVLELGGPALSDFAARAFAQVEQAPLAFAGESAPKDARRNLLVVVGAPARKFIVVGNQGKFSDVNLVGVAKEIRALVRLRTRHRDSLQRSRDPRGAQSAHGQDRRNQEALGRPRLVSSHAGGQAHGRGARRRREEGARRIPDQNRAFICRCRRA